MKSMARKLIESIENKLNKNVNEEHSEFEDSVIEQAEQALDSIESSFQSLKNEIGRFTNHDYEVSEIPQVADYIEEQIIPDLKELAELLRQL